jgi:SAM-dependent methyltransferase
VYRACIEDGVAAVSPSPPRDSAGERTRRNVERIHRRLLRRSLLQGTRALYSDPAFFDRLYLRRRRDVAWYVDAARASGGPVLELGVGSGRVALAIAAAGIEVVGVDASPEMLRAARSASRASNPSTRALITLRLGDMRRLRLDRRFALVIAPFNTFTHLYDRRDLERTLTACRRHLRPGGRLLFDVVMPDLPALLQDPDRVYRCGRMRHPSDGRVYLHSEASHYDPATQVRTVTMLLEPVDGQGPARAIPLTQRQFFPAELDALLSHNGFDIEDRYGDFEYGPLLGTSASQVIVARRAPRLSG